MCRILIHTSLLADDSPGRRPPHRGCDASSFGLGSAIRRKKRQRLLGMAGSRACFCGCFGRPDKNFGAYGDRTMMLADMILWKLDQFVCICVKVSLIKLTSNC